MCIIAHQTLANLHKFARLKRLDIHARRRHLQQILAQMYIAENTGFADLVNASVKMDTRVIYVTTNFVEINIF